jgi:V/A-type H+-transporting ATPase subunit C
MSRFARINDPIRYGFAVGRIRVLETRMLGRSSYERLLDAPTFAEQLRVLSDTHFGRYLDGAKTATDVERGIDASLEGLYDEFLQKANLPEAVVGFFRAPNDFAHLKAVVKSRLLGARLDAQLSPLGTVAVEAFDDPAGIPGSLGETASALLEAEQTPAAEEIDAAVDRSMFEALSGLAREAGIPFLSELAANMVDVANVKVLMRSCLAGRTVEDTEAALVPGGTFDARALAPAVRKPAAELAALLADRGAVSASGAADLTDLQRIDVVADEAVGALMHKARLAANGPEPVIAYVLARQSEAVSVRALLVGKLAGLDREVVRARLREAIA